MCFCGAVDPETQKLLNPLRSDIHVDSMNSYRNIYGRRTFFSTELSVSSHLTCRLVEELHYLLHSKKQLAEIVQIRMSSK